MTAAGLDTALYRAARTYGHAPATERAVARFSHLGEHAALWLAIGTAGVVFDRPRRGRWRRALAGVGAAYVANVAVKLVVRRPRPIFDDLPQLIGTPTQLSFPSSHATSSFAAARAYAPLLGASGSGALPARRGDGRDARLPRRALPLRHPRRRAARHARRRSNSMKVGIVGMPNAGKSSLFNALTKAGAEAANYPFTTIEPNVAIVPVRDERMEQVAALLKSSEIVWDTIAFHDIAGLVKGASEGEGLGNKFLANIRETDAIVHVVRAHTDSSILHSEGSVDPARDVETIETELIYADLEQAERRLERVAKPGARRRQGGRPPSSSGWRRSSPSCRRARPSAPPSPTTRCPTLRPSRCATSRR